MTIRDIHNNIRTVRCLSPVALGTAATGIGKVVDRQGFGGVEFLVSYGAVTSATAVLTLTIKEGSVTGTLTSVADADLLGTELLASLPGVTRTTGVGKQVEKRVGYIGQKRYVQASLVAVGTFAVPVHISALLHSPGNAPTANP